MRETFKTILAIVIAGAYSWLLAVGAMYVLVRFLGESFSIKFATIIWLPMFLINEVFRKE